MKQWTIPVIWEMYGTVEVEASTLEEAMDIARDESSDIPLPDDGSYIDGSWDLSMNETECIRQLYNHNQEDDVKIRYFVCGLAYDVDNCTTDYEEGFGDFDTLEEAKKCYAQVIEKYTKHPSELFDGLPDGIDYWLIQLEKCECTDECEECVDVIDEDYIYNEEDN